MRDAAREISSGLAWTDLDYRLEVAERGGDGALLSQDDAAIDQAIDVARIEFERPVVIAQRISEVALTVTGKAAVEPGGGQLRIGGDGEIEVRDGAFDLAFLQPRVAALQI